uniref:Chemokine interleukin-8-like domain-containing protein n=1 Tax=Sphaeramia orbicularis TaxID=375764 RepID=A0A673BZJ9_9TELE
MNAVIRAVILLACAAICTSRSKSYGHCRCVKTTGSVNPKLIRTVKSYDPRPYCNKKEGGLKFLIIDKKNLKLKLTNKNLHYIV